MNHELDIEPDSPAVSPGQLSLIPEAAPLPLAQALPSDFPLFTLLRFVPDPALKKRADALATVALAVGVTGHDGVLAASAALVPLRDQLGVIRACFKDPKGLAHQLHKRLTGLETDFCKAGDEAVKTQDRAIYDENARLERAADEARRKAQEEADRLTRQQAAEAAKQAAKAGAPKPVVEALKEAAKTATAAPVASPVPAPTLIGMTTVERWKARFRGASAGADPNPEMDALTPAQQAQVRRLMGLAAQGKAPLRCFAIDWGWLNARAAADKTTFDVPEVEAYDAGGTRKR